MATFHWLLVHAAVLAFTGGLLGLDSLLVLAGVAAQHGLVPTAMAFLLGAQGCALREPFFLSLGAAHHNACTLAAVRVSRSLGVLRWWLRPQIRSWAPAILNILGAALLAVAEISAGYGLAEVMAMLDSNTHRYEPYAVASLALVEVALRLIGVSRERSRNRRDQ